MAKRDFQKQRVYDAEYTHSYRKIAIREWVYSRNGSYTKTEGRFKDGTKLMTIHEVGEYVGKIMRSRWWKSRMPNVRFLDLVDGRGTRWATGSRRAAWIFLNIPRWARQPLIILHELAHCMTGPDFLHPFHGREFCANHLDLIKRWLGREAWLEMKECYKDKRVKYIRKAQ